MRRLGHVGRHDEAGLAGRSVAGGPLRPARRWMTGLVVALLAILGPVMSANAFDFTYQRTLRANVTSSEQQVDLTSYGARVSGNGRYVVFHSLSSVVVQPDNNAANDVFVRDIVTGETTRASRSSEFVPGNDTSEFADISDDGRHVAFRSVATNLVPGDTNAEMDVFVRDMVTGETTLVSVSSAGEQGDSESGDPSISDDGRLVAFTSLATNLVPEDTNAAADVFVRDLATGETTRVSVSVTGSQADSSSAFPVISDDGGSVAFRSAATNLVPDDTNSRQDIFVRDMVAGETTRVSVSSSGGQADALSFMPAISDDGRRVAFWSEATNLVAGDTNGMQDAFVRDLDSGETTRVSVSSSGEQGNGHSGPWSSWLAYDRPSISGDGRYVAFSSQATNLVPGDTTPYDLFVRDLAAGETTRVSISTAGSQANAESQRPSVSDDGRLVAFCSQASNLVADDSNGVRDIFVRTYEPPLGPITGLEATQSGASILVNWVKPSGGDYAITRVFRSTTGFAPTRYTGGSQYWLYENTGTNCTDTPLPSIESGTRYYYTAWLRDVHGEWSSVPATAAVEVPPGNDDFSWAQELWDAGGSTTGRNVCGTKEPGEPDHAGVPGGRSVWYKWTAPASGPATISLSGSGFDTVLGVYEGASVDALTEVASNDDSGSITSAVSFTAVQGTTYRIAVDGKGAAEGNIALAWSLEADLPNDDFANATTMVGASGTLDGHNVGATKEAGEPNVMDSFATGGMTVWYKWTAPEDRTLTVDTQGSAIDTVLGAFTGASVDALTRLACNDDAGGGTWSRVSVNAVSGETYYFAVDGYSAAHVGAITLNWSTSAAVAGPPNDDFADAIVLSGPSGEVTGTNIGSTSEPDEPTYNGSSSVWWRWQAPSDGTLTVDTEGSDFDTYLNIYTGDTLAGLTRVAYDDDSGAGATSMVSLPVYAGTTYQIAVKGYADANGQITLHWNHAASVPGAIAGTIRDDAGSPIGGITVDLWKYEGGSWVWHALVGTRPDGTYAFPALGPADYWIRFSDKANRYKMEYYDDVDWMGAATWVTVSGGATYTADATLTGVGKVSGTVRDEGGAPISGITVDAWRKDGGTWSWQGICGTKADGSYVLGYLPADDYRIRFSDKSGRYRAEYHVDAATRGAAADIAVSAGAVVSGTDATLAGIGRISGTIRNGAALPLANITVDAWRWSGTAWVWQRCTGTKADGTYELAGLSTGTYRLRFTDKTWAYRAEYFNDKGSLAAADDIVLTAGAHASGTDAVLAAGP